jgi:hypothetical protein
MTVKRLHLALIAAALLSTIVTFSAGAWQQIDQTTTQARPIETARETVIKGQLTTLLSSVGVHVNEPPPETANHMRLTVRWQSGAKIAVGAESFLAEQPEGPGALTFTDSVPRAGSVPRARSLELATSQMFVVAVDEVQQLLWWNQFADPRILRAEVPDANGQQHIGRTFSLAQTDFTIAYPDNPAIRELRFYHPLWTGHEFQLQLIGSVSVK